MSCPLQSAAARMTGGEAVAATLEANGVDLAFGMPGIHNLAIFDALVDRPHFRFVVVRNEQGASFMANGVGRVTGRPGVCLITTGPAACNALTGVGDAVRDSAPMLVIASQIGSDLIGQNKGAFHEVADQQGMFRAAGAWTTRANRVEQIPASINAAWVAATHGRPGPAYVEIPEDVLYGEAEVRVRPAAAPPRPGLGADTCGAILEMLRQAERPLVLAGAGVHSAGAGDELQALVERLGLPVITTVNGKGAIPEEHPLCAGVLPAGDPAAAELVGRADLMLALATSFSQVNTAAWSLPYPEQLIHVDIDAALIGRSIPAALGVVADVRQTLTQLCAAAPAEGPGASSGWVSEVLELRRAIEAPMAGALGRELVGVMRRLLPADAVVVGDAQSWGHWLIQHFPVASPGRMVWPIHFGTLGFGVPAAIGIQAAFPGRRVVAACGDGGFTFCSNELATAVQHGLNLVVVLVDNRGFESIRRGQTDRFGTERVFAADLSNPDFVAYARSFGCFARRADTLEEFEPALRDALEADGPAVLHVAMDLPWPGAISPISADSAD